MSGSRWVRAGLAIALGATFALGGASACSSTSSDAASSSPAQRRVALQGLYTATSEGVLGDLAVGDAGEYVLRPATCHETRCLETGRTVLDAEAKVLTLEGALGAPRRTLSFRVVTTLSEAPPPAGSRLTPKTDLTGGSSALVESDGGQVVEAGAATTDGSADVLEVVRQATIDGQPVELVVGSAETDAGAPNSTRPPWPTSAEASTARARSFASGLE